MAERTSKPARPRSSTRQARVPAGAPEVTSASVLPEPAVEAIQDVVATDVLDIAYTDLGPEDGPVVVLAHGWPDAARGWAPVAHRLAATGRRVLVPDNRGAGGTRFRSPWTPRDGSGVALAVDLLQFTAGLGIDRFSVVGHDWGARAAYTVAVLAPDRVDAIAALGLGYQPNGVFTVPRDFAQTRRFWYQFLLCSEPGIAAVNADPVGFAREQWNTWSPSGWFTEDEFAATAPAFANPDWVAVTLSAYRSRYLPDEPLDERYDDHRAVVAATDRVVVPTLQIQGGADGVDPAELSEGLAGHFHVHRREVLDGVGHFPHREASTRVAELVLEHLQSVPAAAL
ncbi:alpha/beta fold hydrolase [Nakamurella leprariae]|uniref:Alpha/beta hydrolase n=1 Tax=Nakamurella leprariae TaxID=2803911 RepID=A0A939C3U8_9ACTN|nr:alpha/beta hydrolase [Nakamurella leprariae]MBM9469437.1 alpha/beta hydrolase [Nakamurella leprariae]